MNRVDKIHDRFVRKAKKEVPDGGVDRNIDLFVAELMNEMR